MPTIVEILAARANKTPPTAAAAAVNSKPRPSIAEQVELVEAINRIDAPGKQRGGSLVLSAKTEPVPVEPKTEAPTEPRMIGARVGEALNVLPECPTIQAKAWDAVLNRWETDLIIMADPEPGSESAWLALKPATGGGLPVLLHKLPFWPHPQRVITEKEPY
jgi:hypothetical protein